MNVLNNVYLCHIKNKISEKEEDFLKKQLLSPEEAAGSSQVKDEAHKSIYMQSHAFMRKILSQVLNINPLKIQFHSNAFGKPFLVKKENEPDLFFNLSHTENLAAFILSNSYYTGIDAEKMTSSDKFESVQQVIFHPKEMAEYMSIKNREFQQAFFFRTWTLKECFLKALGIGFHIETDHLIVKKLNEDQYKIVLADMPMSEKITLQHLTINNFSLAFTTSENIATNIQQFRFAEDFKLLE